MDALVDVYRQRPFVDAELWAGKIGRAIEAHRGRISPKELAKETGLTQEQIELGESWQSLDALRWHRRFGKADGPESSGGPRCLLKPRDDAIHWVDPWTAHDGFPGDERQVWR
ncbi:hypothetical protein AQJ66_02185 [Streptomyces bungoensis]|uniref:Uncharacterized protein n=1 Tax=Streptomyces bungoensis TaxID=285568 RepID=A0A101TCH8_9ACTN|nr:hypothetical protein AQJ66_02185 [Streptomyces bungoensis]